MPVRCETCDEEFETPELLATHRREEHGEDDRSGGEDPDRATGGGSGTADAESVGERFICPRCGTEMSSRESLDMHLRDAHPA